MGLWHSLGGMMTAEMTCADPAYGLTLLQNAGVALLDICWVDDFTVRFQTHRYHRKRLRVIADKRGLTLRLWRSRGLYWAFRRLMKRPVLVVGLLMILLLGTYLPTRIFFVQVEGNVHVPTRWILESAAQCGIGFGAQRREVRSEKMKNALLEAMPQLQWAGVNTNGCVAVISVKERQMPENNSEEKNVGSIVAARDGVVTSVTAMRGNAVAKPGMAVKAGEVLISGYTNCGISIRAERASGEVYAQTQRSLSAIYPANRQKRTRIIATEKKYSLLIGKKRINFYFGSGISEGSCVKMYEENYMTLPGGFQLPVCLVTETWTYYDDQSVIEELNGGMLENFAHSYLQGSMIAGKILSSEENICREDDLWVLTGQYACEEMIGQFRNEEIVKPDGTNDRKNSERGTC